MKAFMFRTNCLLISALLISFLASAQAGHIVISQVYGGGGNVSAVYRNDFVELYNPTTAPITFSNWTIQYRTAAGTGTWTDRDTISGTIAAGGYFLIELHSQSGTGAPLPTPDASNTNVNLAASGGKVALVSHTTPLTGASPNNGVIDLVGYGSAATGYESAAASAPSSVATSLHRRNNGCQDTDNNSADFITATPAARNSSSPITSCSASPAIVVGAVSAPFCVDATQPATGTVAFSANGTFNTTFNVYLSSDSGFFGSPVLIGSSAINATNPSGFISVTVPAGTVASTGYKIQIQASSPAVTSSNSVFFEVINGFSEVTAFTGNVTETTLTLNWTNPINCFDEIMMIVKEGSSITAAPSGDGSAYTANLNFGGSSTAFDGGKVVYKGTTSGQTVTGLTAGTTYYIKIFARKGAAWSAGVEINRTPRYIAQPGDVLINQLSPQYGGANDEYIELINLTTKTIDLSDLAIRYQSSSGTSTSAGGVLSGLLAPRRFWLLSPNPTVIVGLTNISRDGSFTPGFAPGAGQVAIVRVSDNVVIDGIGYGTTVPNYVETASAPAPPTNGGLKRVTDGSDGNNNSTDFITVSNSNINLRNSTGIILPVRFTQVKAVREKSQIIVLFTNTTEQDIAYYEVQRSVTPHSFTAIGRIVPQSNNGETVTYQYKDGQPLAGTGYYRIKAVESSGNIVFSPIVAVTGINVETRELLRLYAVKGNQLNFETALPAGNYVLTIHNASGQELLKRSYQVNANGVYNMPVNKMIKGIYFLKLDGNTSAVKSFVVE